MFPSKTLASLVLIALCAVDASPLSRTTGKGSLDFVTKINARGTLNLAEKDRARAQSMIQAGKLGKRMSATFDITNAQVTYTTKVEVGEPATEYTLLIDTGSSNTFVGVNSAYTKTSTSEDTGNTVSVSYGSGSFSGEEWIDKVTLSPDLVIEKQSIGVASTSQGFNGVNGILGVGPTDLTTGTVSNTDTVPTVTDNLYSQGTITDEVLGVYFVPASEKDNNGTLTFGGVNEGVTVGPVEYVPLTTTSPASLYWGIDQSILYGVDTILNSTAGIVDTGTTLILIASDAFQTYKNKTGGTLDSATGLLSITPEQYDALEPLTFIVGNVPYILPSNGQIWPRSLNSLIGGSANSIYLIVNDLGSPSGSGLDFINGFSFLERFYSVYDTTNKQVGFAMTRYTFSQSN